MDAWPPPKPRIQRAVAVPSSTFSQLKEPARTLHAAFFSRAIAIFRVEKVFIYEESSTQCSWLSKVLQALETPQYLRRKLVPRDKDLNFIGITSPLAIPSHQLRGEALPYREGVVLRKKQGVVEVEAGLDESIFAKGVAEPGTRVTLLKKGDEWVVVDRESLDIYWGYRVYCYNSLKELLRANSNDYLIVFTSKYGLPFSDLEGIIKEEALRKGRVLLVFGTWDKGLYEIARREGFDLEAFSNLIVNVAPFQGTRTIRTEEAALIALSLINNLLW